VPNYSIADKIKNKGRNFAVNPEILLHEETY
jgi:hypothetical protein